MSEEHEAGLTMGPNEGFRSVPYVALNLFRVKAAVEKNFLCSSVGKEFECILDQRRVCERKETLFIGKNIR